MTLGIWIKATKLTGIVISSDMLYPCLCWTNPRSCETDFCDCWGRPDPWLQPADCCARRWTAEAAERWRRDYASRRALAFAARRSREDVDH